MSKYEEMRQKLQDLPPEAQDAIAHYEKAFRGLVNISGPLGAMAMCLVAMKLHEEHETEKQQQEPTNA